MFVPKNANTNSYQKKEESKYNNDIKNPNKSQNEIRLKSSKLKNPYKLSYSRNYNDYKQILTELTDINTSKIYLYNIFTVIF